MFLATRISRSSEALASKGFGQTRSLLLQKRLVACQQRIAIYRKTGCKPAAGAMDGRNIEQGVELPDKRILVG